MKKVGKRKGGQRKIGRSKRVKNQLLSAFVRGKISGEDYFRKVRK